MSMSERLAIIITANGAGAISEFKKIETSAARSVGKAETTAGKFKANASRIGAGMVIVGAAVAAGMRVAVAEAEEAARVGRQTDAVIRSTGGAANVTRGHLENLAGALSKVAAVDDEVIQSAGNVLLTFKSVRNETGEGADIFDRATTAALDMSAALGTDLQSSVMALGKALSNPVQGLTALRRAGVDFTQQQRDQVAAMVAVGDTLGAQQLIMAEVESQFAGSAEANATATDRMSVAWGNFLEKLGTPVSGWLEQVTREIEDPMVKLKDLWSIADRPLSIEWNGETLQRMAEELGITKQEMDAFGKEAGDAAAAVQDLNDAIEIYLSDQFDLPEATRNAGESFTEMIATFTDGESTWADQGSAMQDYVEQIADVVNVMSQQGASQQAIDDTMRSYIQTLRAARDDGKMTADTFALLRDQILGIPHGTETRVTTPGAREAKQDVDNLWAGLQVVGRATVRSNVDVITNRVQFDRLVRDLDAADNRRFTMQVSVNTTGGVPRRATGGPVEAGQPYIVGDGGRPELFVPDQPGTILPRVPGATDRTAAGGAAVVHNYFLVTVEQMMRHVPPDQRAKLRRRMLAGSVG